MKKIALIIGVAIIPIIIIIGGLYIFGNIEKNNIIKNAVNEIEDPYYNNLASQCGNKGEFKCCLASVYDMIDLQARLTSEKKCANLKSDSLKCVGSYQWCVPLANVTMPEGAEMDNANDHKACEADSDCVPDNCCHATDVVNKEFAPDCSAVICTMSCETVLDCGQGQPICDDGICAIKTN